MRMELLLDRLAKHSYFRSLLEETTNIPANELVESLVREFEQVAERYKNLSAFAGRIQITAGRSSSSEVTRPTPTIAKSTPRDDAEKSGTKASQPLNIEPIKIGLPPIDLQSAERSIALKRAEEERKALLRKELETVEKKILAEVKQDWDTRADEIRDRIVRLKNSEQFLRTQLAKTVYENEEPVREELSASTRELQPRPEISDDDIVYLHAVALCHEGEDELQTNVVKDVWGIDGNSPVFVIEYEEFRCFVSKMQQDYLGVTKSGMLLLRKEESLHLQAVHEEIVNRLKCAGMHLPFKFGSIVRGKEEFENRMEAAAEVLRAEIEVEEQSHVWSLNVFALDACVSKTISMQQSTARVQDREREPKRNSKRSDIKLLEKMLQYEQKVAEAIYETLRSCSISSAVDSMINIGNGTSEDWKEILRASYEVGIEGRSKFFSTILELQDQYRTIGMMFEVRGTSGRFSFDADSHVPHAIST